MTAQLPDYAHPAARCAIAYAWFTIGYNVVEGVVAVWSGLAAGAMSLVAFGLDSGIEVAAASVVLSRLLTERGGGRPDLAKERRALRLIAITFYALAAYVLAKGAFDLVSGEQPGVSGPGMAITGVSLIVMPWLAMAKRRAGLAMNSRLVVADAAETRLCAWLSLSIFTGLVVFAVAGWTWVDPVAGFVIAAFAIAEGREAWEGELVEDD